MSLSDLIDRLTQDRLWASKKTAVCPIDTCRRPKQRNKPVCINCFGLIGPTHQRGLSMDVGSPRYLAAIAELCRLTGSTDIYVPADLATTTLQVSRALFTVARVRQIIESRVCPCGERKLEGYAFCRRCLNRTMAEFGQIEKIKAVRRARASMSWGKFSKLLTQEGLDADPVGSCDCVYQALRMRRVQTILVPAAMPPKEPHA